jgi:hypothetical protein
MSGALDSALKRLKLSDAAFGAQCQPPIHRSQIWTYRKQRRMPLSDTASSILAALRKHGIELTVEELIGASRSSTRRRKTKAA